jgi:phage-related minor tail protein
MTAKEALGSFFKSVADMFLEMAAQIIAKQITMIILQTILKALGAVAGGGGIKGAGNDAGAKAFGGSGPKFNPGTGRSRCPNWLAAPLAAL